MNVLDKKNTKELNLSDLLVIIKSHWMALLAATVLCALVVFGYSKVFITPQYRASAQLFVDTRKVSSEGKDTYMSQTQIAAAKELAATYVHIIKTNTVLNAVIEELDLDISYNQLKNKITAEVVDETQLLKIYVTDTDKATALKIAEKLVEIAPDMVNEKVDSGKLVSIDNPEVSSAPVSPNVSQNTLIGAALGFVLLYGYYLIKRLLDNKFKSAESIQKTLDLPVLGVIPALDKLTSK